MGEVATPGSSLVLVTNIAPQATRDQMLSLFNHVGRVEEIKLYPSIRDASVSVDSRCCFIRFDDPGSVCITQHLNNTVFIDRAIIITPVVDGVIPDETEGLFISQRVHMQQQQTGGGIVAVKGATCELVGAETAESVGANDASEHDPALEAACLPQYPPLPPGTPAHQVGEIRRTVMVVGVDSTVSAQQCMEFFAEAGEVKYFRYCTRENDPVKYALIEFSEKAAVVTALLFSGRQLGTSPIQVTHAIEAIAKPQAKSNEAAQREIEEAMSKVKEAQSLVSAAVDPLMGMFGGVTSRSRTRSRSRSKSRRRSRSRGRSSYNDRRRSRSRDRRRRSRTRSRDRRRSRSRDKRRRSRSRSRDRRRRSRSRDRDSRRRRSRSRSRDRDRKRDRDRDKDKDRDDDKRSRSRSPEKKRKRSRSRSRDRRRKRSRSRDKKRRSRSRDRDRRKRSRSKDRKRSRSRDRKAEDSSSKIKRDYDKEEEGFEQPKDEKTASPAEPKNDPPAEESTEAQDMEISNSP